MVDYLVIGLIVVALIQVGLLYRISADLRELLGVNKKWAVQPQAETDLQNGEIDAVIERCRKDIADHPEYARPNWYLGKAYYKKEMWKEAKEQLELVAQLEPTWRTESIDPYLRAIEERLRTVSN